MKINALVAVATVNRIGLVLGWSCCKEYHIRVYHDCFYGQGIQIDDQKQIHV